MRNFRPLSVAVVVSSAFIGAAASIASPPESSPANAAEAAAVEPGEGSISKALASAKDGRSYDSLQISRNGRSETVTFDITGFFCEMGLEP